MRFRTMVSGMRSFTRNARSPIFPLGECRRARSESGCGPVAVARSAPRSRYFSVCPGRRGALQFVARLTPSVCCLGLRLCFLFLWCYGLVVRLLRGES